MPQVMTQIATRDDFGILCNEYNVLRAVEVGTDRGIFASRFMQEFTGIELICVDPFVSYDYGSGLNRECDAMMAVLALQPYHGRVRIVREYSPDVISRIPDWIKQTIGFVYIDGMHDYVSVKKDAEAWWQVLQLGGILAGHDYDDRYHPGVVKAVDEFAQAHGLEIRLTTEEWCKSWWVVK